MFIRECLLSTLIRRAEYSSHNVGLIHNLHACFKILFYLSPASTKKWNSITKSLCIVRQFHKKYSSFWLYRYIHIHNINKLFTNMRLTSTSRLIPTNVNGTASSSVSVSLPDTWKQQKALGYDTTLRLCTVLLTDNITLALKMKVKRIMLHGITDWRKLLLIKPTNTFYYRINFNCL
jgi:hypothetical protein